MESSNTRGTGKQMRVDDLSFVEVPERARVGDVLLEPHSRGWCYVGRDRRREFLLAAQTVDNLMVAFEELAREELSRSRCYSAARKQVRRGYVGSFMIDRISLHEAPDYLSDERGRFARVVVATACRRCWKIEQEAR